MKRSCSLSSKLLEKFFDGEVTEQERNLVEEHLQRCAACREALRSMGELRTFIKAPFEKALRNEDFPWVWQKIEREIRLAKKQSWWQSLRARLHLFPVWQKKVWIPAVATAVVLLLITAQFVFQDNSSYSDNSVIEYVESDTNNVMVYESEKSKMAVIWLFETPEQESSAS